MKFARYSAALLKKKESSYNLDYFYNLLKLLIQKGYRLKAYKIIYKFIIKSRVYFKMLYRKISKKKIKYLEEKEKNNLLRKKNMIRNSYLNMKNLNNIENFDFIKMFNYLINNYSPLICFVNRKVAATTYKLPYIVSEARSKMIFLRWFVKSASERTEKSMSDKLLNEFLDIYYGTGRTLKKLEEYYEEGKKNYPFIRFLRTRKKFSKLIIKKYHLRK